MHDRTDLLSNMFTDRRFKRLGQWLFFANIDGVKIGVAVANLNADAGYYEHALNQESEERVLAALAEGRIDEGYTVFANGSFNFEYTGHAEAREFHQKIVAMGLQPRPGRYGPFYRLPAILTMGTYAPI
jgi:hypothetical protein